MSKFWSVKPGAQVVFRYPTLGEDHDQVFAEKHLKLKETYTIDHCEVLPDRVFVLLREVPGIAFNSEMFGFGAY